ncbi:MAG: gag protein [Wolinella sp.]
MQKIHDNVLVKKTRYDLNLSVENASKFEQLCEAYNLPKSQMADRIIEDFCRGNPVYSTYIKNLRAHKKQFIAKHKEQRGLLP